MARPVVIGLTGGVASGKSTVADMFRRLGALILKGDRIGHEILDDQHVQSQIRAIWGGSVFKNGIVDRAALGDIVFGSPNREALSRLESITHPKIEERIRFELQKAEQQNQVAVVLDAPLLFEAGWDAMCDKLVFIHADLATRKERAKSRGWSDQELQRREKQQLDLQHKRDNSTDIIDNSTNQETTFSQIRRLWMSWGFTIPQETESSNN